MQTKSKLMLGTALLGVVLFLNTPALHAAEKVDPAGTWTWTVEGRDGNTMTSTLKLRQENGKLAGTVTGRGGREDEIENATLDGERLSFQVTRERNGNRSTAKYAGKISGDRIDGKVESNWGGEARTRDWVAKREARVRNVTGHWKYTLTTPSGQSYEPVLKLKQDGQKVTGTVAVNEYESPIEDGQVKGDEVSFKVERERDGRKFISRYNGKIEENRIKGKVHVDWGGEERTFDMEATRQK
jgi:hypothetical protein